VQREGRDVGGSDAGFDQWATAKERPPHLSTIVPAAAAAAAVDFPFLNNISYPYIVQWRTYTSGVTPNLNLFLDHAFWIARFQEMFRSHRPFQDFDILAGNPSDWFQRTLEHPRPDDYWKAMRPGAFHYYRMHMKLGRPEIRERHYLLVGPWDHPGTRTPNRDVGGLPFDEASLLDLNDLHRQWYDWTMKDGPRPSFLKKRVAYYVVGGKEEWKYADDLEGIARELSGLGAGGMGEVYRARDSRLHREVALKTLPDELARHPEHLSRLRQEARLLASLNHPALPRGMASRTRTAAFRSWSWSWSRARASPSGCTADHFRRTTRWPSAISFYALDGHHWEVFWMDPKAI
jgi:hypothetical protein